VASDELTQRVRSAVESFWFKLDEQAARLSEHGISGGAARANGHMGDFTKLVAQMFIEAGISSTSIKIGAPYLPGYYRVRKQWDLVIKHHGHLVAAVEFKSQVGSVGKNFNNCFEEALGTATDTHTAQRKYGAFGEVPPWLAYVFVLQESPETERLAKDAVALFPVDPQFAGLSYNQRYQMMISRFIGDQVYDAGWFITTKRDFVGRVSYLEPLATACTKSFVAAVNGRVNYINAVIVKEGE
jgi:Restriction endonuclease XhoI